MIILELFIAWLLADFLTGLGHWVEDRFINRGPIHEANDRHHERPAALLRDSYWSNINSTVAVTVPLATFAHLLGAPFVVTAAIAFATFANIIHRWSHELPSRVPRIVRLLQRTGFFMSRSGHMRHHYDFENNIQKLSRAQAHMQWCAMTDWLNPILDRVDLFRALDRIFGKAPR